MSAILGEIQEGGRSGVLHSLASFFRSLNPWAPLDHPKIDRLDLRIAKPTWPEKPVAVVPAIAARTRASEPLARPQFGLGIVVGTICAVWNALAVFVLFVDAELKSAILLAARGWKVIDNSSSLTRGIINGPSGAADAARLYAVSSHA